MGSVFRNRKVSADRNAGRQNRVQRRHRQAPLAAGGPLVGQPILVHHLFQASLAVGAVEDLRHFENGIGVRIAAAKEIMAGDLGIQQADRFGQQDFRRCLRACLAIRLKLKVVQIHRRLALDPQRFQPLKIEIERLDVKPAHGDRFLIGFDPLCLLLQLHAQEALTADAAIGGGHLAGRKLGCLFRQR